MPSEVAARAHCLLGNLLAIGPDANHEEALEHHLKAIDLGIDSTDDRRFATRRMAKHVLVDAHMSVARDIALGNFQRQQEVVPKWLLRATELADEFISDDNGDELLRLHVFRNTLPGRTEADDQDHIGWGVDTCFCVVKSGCGGFVERHCLGSPPPTQQ